MRSYFLRRLFLAVCIFTVNCNATASTTYKVDATFTNFISEGHYIPLAPYQPLHFSLVFSLDLPGSTAASIQEVELALGPKTFTASEIGFQKIGRYNLFGATLNGADFTQWGTFDFYFIYDPAKPTDFEFSYSAPTNPYIDDGWYSDTAIDYSISAVSEPPVLLLLPLGLLVIGAARRVTKPRT